MQPTDGAPPMRAEFERQAKHSVFVVVKGYHMGSLWFAEAFSRLRGCALYFEYEHCLRHGAATAASTANSSRPVAAANSPGPVLLPPSATQQFLHRGCACANLATARAPLAHCGGCASGQQCRAAGISFGALGPEYLLHIRGLLQLEPRAAVIVHLRTNHIKHALSFLRTSCRQQPNHATAATAASTTTNVSYRSRCVRHLRR